MKEMEWKFLEGLGLDSFLAQLDKATLAGVQVLLIARLDKANHV